MSNIQLSKKIKHSHIASGIMQQPFKKGNYLYYVVVEGVHVNKADYTDFDFISLNKYSLKEQNLAIKKKLSSINDYYISALYIDCYEDRLYINFSGALAVCDFEMENIETISFSKEKLNSGYDVNITPSLFFYINRNQFIFSNLKNMQDEYISNYNISNESLVWQNTIKDDISKQIIGNETHIYINFEGEKIQCLDQETGNEVWLYIVGNNIIDSNLFIVENQLFFGTENGFIVCLDITTGKEVWKIQLNTTQSTSSLTYVEKEKRFYLLDIFEAYSIIDISGQIIKHVNIDYHNSFKHIKVMMPINNLTITEKYVVSAGVEGTLFILDKETGEIIWNYNLDIKGSISQRSTPIIYDNAIYMLDMHEDPRLGGTLHKVAFE